MSGLSDALTDLAARSYPRARRADAVVVRDCAREAIDASGPRAIGREWMSLVGAGLRVRARVATVDLAAAPWRAALSSLTLPLATAILLLWTFAFVPRYDHWPLGEGWVLLLGGSLLAVAGAARGTRWLTALGAGATFVAAASPYLGMGTDASLTGTPSFYQGLSVDIGAASLLPTLLLLAGALAMPPKARRERADTAARLALGVVPAAIAALALLPNTPPEPTMSFMMQPSGETTVVAGPPYPMPWIAPSQTLLLLLAIALAQAVVLTWARARSHPEGLLATGLVVLTVAYPMVWAILYRLELPYQLYGAAYVWLFTAIPLLLAFTLVRKAGRLARR